MDVADEQIVNLKHKLVALKATYPVAAIGRRELMFEAVVDMFLEFIEVAAKQEKKSILAMRTIIDSLDVIDDALDEPNNRNAYVLVSQLRSFANRALKN